jgi:hypothetical protein
MGKIHNIETEKEGIHVLFEEIISVFPWRDCVKPRLML